MAIKEKSQIDSRSLVRQIDELHNMKQTDLRKKWNDLFGTEPGQLGRQYLIRRLACRIQELVYGGLSREARKQLKEFARNPNGRKKSKREATNLQVGTRLLRDWRGNRYEVIVQQDGFLYSGKTYRSLSAVARAITGKHKGGRRFFGLEPGGKRGPRAK